MNKEKIEKEIRELDNGVLKVLDKLDIRDVLHTINGDKIKIVFNDIECIYSVEENILRIYINKVFEIFPEIEVICISESNREQKKFERIYNFIKEKSFHIREIIKNNL